MNSPDSLTTATDRESIDAFVSRQEGRSIVAVQGLGFVGSVMSFVCANAINGDHAVIGVDQPTEAGMRRIRAINEGRLPIRSSDPKVEAFYDSARERGVLLATWDPHAYAHADVIIVDINLDVQKESDPQGNLQAFDVDIGPFREAMRSIGRHCREDVLVVVETTVPPGTCERIAYPVLCEEIDRRGLRTDRIRVGHSYERVMPGPDYVDSIQNFYRVYSGIDEASADATEAFLRTIIRTDEYPLTRLDRPNATEMAKVLENAYRAMNIAFIVEWSRFAEEAGVDLYEVVKAIRMRPTHANMMLPGLGVGGYCLTKDPLLASWSRKTLFGSAEGLAQSEQGVRINDRMPHLAFEHLRGAYTGKPLSACRVLLLGAAYRGDVDDTRFSPVEPFYRQLREAGAEIVVHDFFVGHWRECNVDTIADLDTALASDPDIVVVCTGHTGYRRDDLLVSRLTAHPRGVFVLDTIGLMSREDRSTLAEQHTVRLLGSGAEA